MMRRLAILVSLLLASVVTTTRAQVSLPAGPAASSSTACGTNGGVGQTLSSASSIATLSCPGAGSYEVRIIPTSGSSLVGALTSNDLDNANAPSQRTLYKNGVGALEVATDTLTGGSAPLTYRTCGGNNLTIGLSSYTSGSAAVYITASYAVTMSCLNGSVDSREDRAVRNGKAYSGFAQGTVTAGQYMSLLLTNPTPAAGSVGTRVIISYRGVACNDPTGVAASQWWAITNPTTNLPTTAAVVAKRGGNNAVAANAVLTMTTSGSTYPDTATSTPLTSRPMGFTPTGGADGGPGLVKKLLDPGMSYAISVIGIATGIAGATNPICKIDFIWEEESVN